MLRALVKGSFAYSRGGTALTIEILEGVARPGDVVHLLLVSREVDVTIRGAGMVDYDIGRPTFHADVVILVDGVEPSEVHPGTVVTT